MLLTGAAMSQTRLNIIQLRESWTGMGISETIQYTDACHAILFQQFNCAAAFGNQAVVRTISNPHHDVVRTISNPHHDVVRTISNPHHNVVRTISNPHHIVVRIRPSLNITPLTASLIRYTAMGAAM